jgi:hypothetical protein
MNQVLKGTGVVLRCTAYGKTTSVPFSRIEAAPHLRYRLHPFRYGGSTRALADW